MLTGLNSNTATNLQLGAGAVLKNKYTSGTAITDSWKQSNVLTATNGGITFTAVPNWYTPTVDGANGNVKGLRFITDWTVTLSFTATDAGANVLMKALGCASQDANGVITGKYKVEASDYGNIYVIAEKGDGSIIQITVKNALNTNGLNLTTANNGNGGISFTFNGHYGFDDLNTPPFEIETIVASQPSQQQTTPTEETTPTEQTNL